MLPSSEFPTKKPSIDGSLPARLTNEPHCSGIGLNLVDPDEIRGFLSAYGQKLMLLLIKLQQKSENNSFLTQTCLKSKELLSFTHCQKMNLQACTFFVVQKHSRDLSVNFACKQFIHQRLLQRQ